MVINRLYLLYLFCFNRKYTNTRIKGDMKKSILLIITLAFLNACAEYSAFVGPSITMAKSGSVLQSGTSLATSYGIKKAIGQSPGEYVLSLAKKNHKPDTLLDQNNNITLAQNNNITAQNNNITLAQNDNIRECETTHSSSLTEIFFDTLDEIDCLRDPFSTLK